ncbi:MAG: hypothetical protein K2H20_03435 [Bacilli bacterium]|nr:hypothetical protein [Bacilli bacterium]
MGAIIDAFDWLINFFKTIFNFISNTFETLGMVFKYIYTIIRLATDVILTLPTWLHAFGFITISICAIYMIIGREAGKSDPKGGGK